MVKLTRIYTRSGDDGRTALGTGARVSKADPRVEAYGMVDEANAVVGSAVLACQDRMPGVAEALRAIQHDLFDVGADLCTPVSPDEKAGGKLRVVSSQTRRLEDLIDEHNAGLGALSSFVLPGGSAASCALHHARTVCRRAERVVAGLLENQPGTTNPEALRYLNRLSDLLFVLGRAANADCGGDVLWQPGKTRGPDAPGKV